MTLLRRRHSLHMGVHLQKYISYIYFLQVGSGQNLIQHPFYQYVTGNWNGIVTQPACFDHTRTNLLVADCFQEIQFDSPLHPT